MWAARGPVVQRRWPPVAGRPLGVEGRAAQPPRSFASASPGAPDRAPWAGESMSTPRPSRGASRLGGLWAQSPQARRRTLEGPQAGAV